MKDGEGTKKIGSFGEEWEIRLGGKKRLPRLRLRAGFAWAWHAVTARQNSDKEVAERIYVWKYEKERYRY